MECLSTPPEGQSSHHALSVHSFPPALSCMPGSQPARCTSHARVRIITRAGTHARIYSHMHPSSQVWVMPHVHAHMQMPSFERALTSARVCTFTRTHRALARMRAHVCAFLHVDLRMICTINWDILSWLIIHSTLVPSACFVPSAPAPHVNIHTLHMHALRVRALRVHA